MATEGEVRADEVEEEEERRDPQVEARRRIALAQIRQYPDAVLRMRANEVEQFDDDLSRLANRMAMLMQEAEDEEQPTAVVNPEITARSRDVGIADEGCLSIQGVLVPVERSLAVTLEGRDLEGKALRLELEDPDARVVQHELDHLDGILMLERTDPESRGDALATLRRRL